MFGFRPKNEKPANEKLNSRFTLKGPVSHEIILTLPYKNHNATSKSPWPHCITDSL